MMSENIICGLFNVVNQDGWLIGDEHPRVGFEGGEYEFVYTKVPFPKLKGIQSFIPKE